MGKPFSFLFVLAILFLPARARALPTQEIYQAFIGGLDAGTLVFDFDAWAPGACEYVMTWDIGHGVPAELCVVDELTAEGRQSCLANAFTAVDSLLTLSPTFDCYGLDPSDQDSEVFLLVLGERAPSGDLAGLIQFGSAENPFAGFQATPIPLPEIP